MNKFLASFIDSIQGGNGALAGAAVWVIVGIIAIACLIGLFSLASSIVKLVLSIKYVKFNRTKNSCGKTGEQIAREILDKNGLQHIKVSKNGSLLYGNSYSHFFKKVRLRRTTWKKASVASMAMASQKSSLAIMDSQKDPLMKKRNVLSPIIYLGPLGFIPLVLLGVLFDFLIFKTQGIFTIALSLVALAFYAASFAMAIVVFKSEVKAQKLAMQIMQDENLATQEEISMCKELFTLYNIEYINNMIVALVELIYRVLQFLSMILNRSSRILGHRKK